MNNVMEESLNLAWTDYRSSVPLQVFCLAMALAIHSPLFFMKMNMHKSYWEAPKRDHVITDVNIISELPKPAVQPPPPAPTPKQLGWKDKLKALITKAPPPPPPPPKTVPKAPEKLDTGPKPIELQPKLELPKAASKLESKQGFQANSPKAIEEKAITLKPLSPVAAPLSERKLGTMADRSALKSSRGNFKMAKTEALSGIGGSGPALAGPSAPTIAIPVAGRASKESFAAPAVSAANKGKLGNVPTGGMGTGSNMTLKEKMIARDVASAAPIAISGSRGGQMGGVPGGVEGGVGSKQNAGHFQGGLPSGSLGGSGLGSDISSNKIAAPKIVTPVKPKEKKSMFLITGPLKDRAIEKKTMPEYPSWAIEQGIEAAVILEFTVDINGFVKEIMSVIRTSGYPKLDDSAMKALRTWKFKPLPEDKNEEQIGRITFNYSLN